MRISLAFVLNFLIPKTHSDLRPTSDEEKTKEHVKCLHFAGEIHYANSSVFGIGMVIGGDDAFFSMETACYISVYGHLDRELGEAEIRGFGKNLEELYQYAPLPIDNGPPKNIGKKCLFAEEAAKMLAELDEDRARTAGPAAILCRCDQTDCNSVTKEKLDKLLRHWLRYSQGERHVDGENDNGAAGRCTQFAIALTALLFAATYCL